jgi:hypothetical protein
MKQRPESPDVQTGKVMLVMAGFLLLVVAVALGFVPAFRDRIGIRFVMRHDFPKPAVLADERSERAALEAQQRGLLAGNNGRMPIRQAMAAIAAKGSAAFDPLP